MDQSAAPAPPAVDTPPTLRHRVYEIIEIGQGEDWASRAFDRIIVSLIVLNIAAFVAETVPSIRAAHGPWLEAFETFSVAVFTLEYAARLWTAVEVPFLARKPAWQARLLYAQRPAMVIDLLAILPFYLAFLFSLDLRVMRILRLLRFLKLSRYSPAMHTLVRVLANEHKALIGAGLLLLASVLFAATGIYYLEGERQPEAFGSVPQAAWWAVATLTTVGYGDVTPVTPLGRLFGALVMICGLCILALPVAIVSTGFAQEVARRDFVVTWSLMSRIPLLAGLEASEVAELMPMLSAHNLPPNVEVIAPGQPGQAMYFIASGRIARRDPDGETHFVAGDFFGCAAMVDNDIHTAPFVTAGRCRLLKLHREDFRRLEAAQPGLAAHIRKVARTRGERHRQRAATGDPGAGPAAG